MKDLQYKIALSCIPKIGPLLARRLVAYTGGVEAVFKEKKKLLEKIPGIGQFKASLVNALELLKEAEAEVEFIIKENISAYFYLDENYPPRLRECEDAPILLYVKGKGYFEAEKVISIVGTRNASDYGKSSTQELINYLASRYPNIVVVSGLAYGIDIAAHKSALKNNLMTLAALGHGLNYIYPSLHSSWAGKIIESGALVTEFRSNRKPDPGNFISRNRIIAGLADATIIVESAEKGGALITADIANSYNREVFAFPGRNTDIYSRGCNNLIKTNKAALVECGADIEQALGWFHKKEHIPVQGTLFTELNDNEREILAYITNHGQSSLDEISIAIGLSVAKTSASLLNMEFNGLIRPMPGKYFRKN